MSHSAAQQAVAADRLRCGYEWRISPIVALANKAGLVRVGGKKEEVLDVCRRYMNLLEALVASLVATHP